MEIRRIDDVTLKFTLTEDELESRGIEQDEIWCDREKGEKLFIDMLEEAYQKTRFEVDGPLWVEAHMYDDGVEITVTKGQSKTSMNISESNDNNDSHYTALENDKGGDQSMMNHDMYSSQLSNRSIVEDNLTDQKNLILHSSVYRFKDIENVIQLAHRLTLPFYNSKLFHFNHNYYLVVMYPEQKLIRGKDWVESLILEYGERGHITIHRLEEYGKAILLENAFAHVKEYFGKLA
jgi:adapter protein MecA 1/2